MAPKTAPESAGESAEPRRSGRIASQPPPSLAAAASKPASKAKPASSKKRAAEEDTTESKKPASKKSKPESKAAEKTEKPASKAAATKPASKAAADKEKPASKAAKPASTKTADKPKSAAKPKSGKGAAAPKEDAIPEEKEEKEKEAPKNAKPTTGEKGEIEVGGKLPEITLKTNKGEDVNVSTLAKSEGVVIFTYPKADTPGCNKQACGYRDVYDEFAKLGYKVVGLSSDTVAAQQKWVDKNSFQYELLADPNQELIKALGCFVAPKNTKRSHFIFEKGTGKLIDKKVGVKPESDPTDCVKFIKAHHK